ncbi:iron-sulfur cluster assembly scaffold protein [Erythrobacter mangrovi]|uniref:Iron-sulfur cluster assembly scaffold protein n=1 Tax=Erythrobacter mangrovi TaxID=2739433 RepID=A0A7D4AU17_9SPHN|nr:iron-sulfur cluster assembly scaffold protein [Erythrobacter mangrovi]QKG71577.1 iron-sulfur cluster assembly scaffold protein [Erythrobacter mangrovi]
MTASQRTALYSPELLALAVELADCPLDPAMPLQGHARSRTCGSTITFSARGDGRIETFGMRVAACAVGQAAAALFARSATGRTTAEVEEALDQLRGWLAKEGAEPTWPGIGVLAPARDHPGRHEAILLPWRAALDALCNAQTRG